jgi:hypothetical protein
MQAHLQRVVGPMPRRRTRCHAPGSQTATAAELAPSPRPRSLLLCRCPSTAQRSSLNAQHQSCALRPPSTTRRPRPSGLPPRSPRRSLEKKKEPCAALPVCARALQTRLQVLGPGTMQRVLSWASSFPFTITSRCTRAQCPDRTILRLRARESFVAWSVRESGVRVRVPSVCTATHSSKIG